MKHAAIAKSLGGVLLTLMTGLAWSFPTSNCAVATTVCRSVSFSNGLISAQATFVWDDTNDFMYIALSNTSANTTQYNVNDVLTGLFFTLKDAAGNYAVLTEQYADIDWAAVSIPPPSPTNDLSSQADTLVRASDGALVLNPNQTTESDVGSEWAYKDGTDGKLYKGFKAGVSSTTLGGLFGVPTFCGTGGSNDGDPSSACSAASVDGFPYGLVGSGFTSLSGGTNLQTLAKDSVLLKFATATTATFDLTKAGSLNAGFQYGDSAAGPLIKLPVPSTLALLSLGALVLGWRYRKQV